MKVKLDKYERSIENDAESYRPLSKREQQTLEGVLEQIRKPRNINIGISEMVFEGLKRRSREKGSRIRR